MLTGKALVVLIDINPHSKYQVATITGTLKCISHKNLNSIALRMAKTLWSFGHPECKGLTLQN